MAKKANGAKPNQNSRAAIVATFIKKNVYIILMIACILAIGTMITVAAVINSKNGLESPIDNNPNQIDKPDDKPVEKPVVKPDKPVEAVFMMLSPVNSSVYGKSFSNTQPVWYQTLGCYGTYEALGIMAEEGATVSCAYDGKVVDIQEDALYGQVVEIQHIKGFNTVYKLMENVTVKIGDVVKKGAKIGEVSAKPLAERGDGIHLRFELLENGNYIDPLLYMSVGDK